ncbi:hypothetical protein [Metabacillus fastidiosus]|uniref:phage lytic cycle repressor MrpR family protein n=1 Tax=Metabacillus fastidiosus TaxID=1458 RepID=UPI003D2D389D
MSKMYNEQLKQEFLDTFIESTSETYKFIFYRTAETEEVLERDLYTFSTEEIKDTLISFRSTTLNSIKLSHFVISSYITWAAKYREYGNINPALDIKVSELRTYIDHSLKLYISEDELIEIENKLVNYQDKAIVRAIFEGINGYQHSELRNLTIHDLKKARKNNNTLLLKDDKYGERELQVSDRCLLLLEEAAVEKTYFLQNGKAVGKRTSVPLIENDYVIRSKRTRINEGRVDRHLIYRTVSSISELFELKYLRAKNIEKSGMIKFAKDIMTSDEIDNEILAKVAKRFNAVPVIINGNSYTNLKEFINIDNIRELYSSEEIK